VTKGPHTLYVKMREDGAWIRNAIIWKGNATFDGCNAAMGNCCDSDTGSQVPAEQFPESGADFQQCFQDCQLNGEAQLEDFLPGLHFLNGLSACGVDQKVFMQYLETRKPSEQDGRLSRIYFAPSYFSNSDNVAFLPPISPQYPEGMVGFPSIQRRYTFSIARREDIWLRGLLQTLKNYGMHKVAYFGAGIPFIGVLRQLQAESFLDMEYKVFETEWLPTENPEPQRVKAGMVNSMMQWKLDAIVMVWPFGTQHFPEYASRFVRFLKYFEAIHRPKAVVMPRLITDCCVGSSMPGAQNSWTFSYSPTLLGSTYEDSLLPKSKFDYQSEFPNGIMNAQGQDLSTALQALQTAFQFKDITNGGQIAAKDFLDDATNYEHLVDYFNSEGSNTIYGNTVYGPIAFEKKHGRAEETLSQHGTTIQMDAAQEARVVLPDKFQQKPLVFPSPATSLECPEDTFMKFDPVACPMCDHTCESCPANTTTKGKKDANFRDCECQAGFYKAADIRLYSHAELFAMGEQYCENGGQPKAFEWSKFAFLSSEKYYDTILQDGPCQESAHTSDYFDWRAGTSGGWEMLWSHINQTDPGYSNVEINGATKVHPLWNVMHFCDDMMQPDNMGDVLLPGASALKCQGYKCEACPSGWFLETAVLHKVCKPCEDGSFAAAPGSTSCTPCPKGQFSMQRASATSASMAAASSAVDMLASTALGYANSRCEVCGIGEYQANMGSTFCEKCPSPMVTRAGGAKGVGDCQCPAGYYAKCLPQKGALPATAAELAMHCGVDVVDPKDLQCVKCDPDAQDCSGFAVVVKANMEIRKGLNALCVSSSTLPEGAVCVHAPPLPHAGFWASEAAVYDTYDCGKAGRCQGGTFGSVACAENWGDFACGTCSDGYYIHGSGLDQCSECDGPNFLFVICIYLVCFVAACVVYWTDATQPKTLERVAAGASLGLIAQTLQFIGVIEKIQLLLPDGFGWAFSITRVLMLNFDEVGSTCISSSDPLGRGVSRLLVPFGAVLFLVAAMFTLDRLNYLGANPRFFIARNINSVINTIGILWGVFFLSIMISIVGFVQCYEHKSLLMDGRAMNGREESSLVAYPEIKCDGNGTHVTMSVFAGIMLTVYLLLPFMFLQRIVVKSRRMFLETKKNEMAPQPDLLRLYELRYHFLLVRYGVARSYWHLASIVRNTFVALVPVLFSGRATQIVIYSVLLAIYGLLVSLRQPWVTKGLSYIEGGILIGLACVSAYFIIFTSESERADAEGLVSAFSALILTGIILSLVANMIVNNKAVSKQLQTRFPTLYPGAEAAADKAQAPAKDQPRRDMETQTGLSVRSEVV